MRVEDVIRQAVKHIGIVDFIACKAKVDRIDMLCRCKDLDRVLRIFLLDEKLFADYSKIKHMRIVVGSDHRKGFLQ